MNIIVLIMTLIFVDICRHKIIYSIKQIV